MNDEYLIYGETLTSIADAIRDVSSVSTTWTPDEMAAYILANLVKPTSRQAAKTYTPGTSNQTIPAGTFLTGAATIQGDSDLAVGNIKKGVNIFGKTGTLSGIWGTPDTFYGFTKVKSGSLTIASNTDSAYTITHSLGVLPKLAAFIPDGTIAISGGSTSNNNILAFLGFQSCTETNLAANTSPADGMFLIASLRSSAWHYTNSVGGLGATESTYMTSSKNTMFAYNDLACHVTSSTMVVGNTSTWIRPATYKWLVMG